MKMTDSAISIVPGEGFSPLLSTFASPAAQRRKKKRQRRALPAPEYSARLYVLMDSGKVHLFRFYLETEANLGLMTVVDRWRAALLVRFSPHQEKDMRAFLESLRVCLDLQVLEAFSL